MTGECISIEETLQKQGVYVSTTAGVSMYPMLRDRRDTIVIRPCQERLKKYDVPLYRRGEKYVLHRIIAVLPDGYLIRGDNCIAKEHVKEELVIGVLDGFFRGERRVNMQGAGYRLYVRIWCAVFPLRLIANKIRAIANKIKSSRKS